MAQTPHRQTVAQAQGGASVTTGGKSLDVRPFIQNAQFPASREDLHRQAEGNDVDDDILVIIDALPEGPFPTVEAVIVAFNEANDLYPSPPAIAHTLRGIRFPARKSDLVKQAVENDADPDLVALLAALPASEYRTMAAVMKAYGELRH
jgi:hypothetical protein